MIKDEATIIGAMAFDTKTGSIDFLGVHPQYRKRDIATTVTTFLFNMMRLLGENDVAAITIIIYTQFLLTALYIGFSMGVAPIISYHFGSKDDNRLKRIFRMGLLFICVASVMVYAIAMLFGSSLVSIFSAKGTPVYQIARQGFLIFPISFLFCGFNIFASATFTALSNGKVSAICG